MVVVESREGAQEGGRGRGWREEGGDRRALLSLLADGCLTSLLHFLAEHRPSAHLLSSRTSLSARSRKVGVLVRCLGIGIIQGKKRTAQLSTLQLSRQAGSE